jgi:YVTN family beta-propeller protein
LTRALILLVAAVTGSVAMATPGGAPARSSDLQGQRGILWVVNRSNDNVTAYDGRSGSVLATIAVGRQPNSVVVAPGIDKAYVTNEISNTVSVISAMTKEVVTTIPVPSGPHHIRASVDGRRVYVSEFATNKVAVIDTATDSVAAEYTTHPSANARNHSSWITPDRRTLYLVNEGVNEITAIDANSGAQIFALAVGNRPSEVLVAPDGRRAYVSVRAGENKIKAIDLTTRALAGEVSLGQQPDTLQVTPDGKFLLVGMRGSPAQLVVIDGPALTVVATVNVADAGTVGGHNWISANGRYSFITYEGGSSPGIAVVDHRAGHTVVARYPYPGGGRPHGVYYDDPAAREGPAVVIASRATASPRGVAIRVTCSAEAIGFCRGRVTLAGIGGSSLSADAGRSVRVQVKPSKARLSKIVAARRVRARATVVASDQLGNARTTARIVLVTTQR